MKLMNAQRRIDMYHQFPVSTSGNLLCAVYILINLYIHDVTANLRRMTFDSYGQATQSANKMKLKLIRNIICLAKKWQNITSFG